MILRINFFIVAFLFALCSSLRIPFIPELQLFLLVSYTFKRKKIDYQVVMLLATILCTHHYAIPDSIFREDGALYPSIYTRAYGSLKILDLLVVFLFTISLPKFFKSNILRLLYIKGMPSFFLLTSLIGIFFLNRETFAKDQFMFIARSYLLFFVLFIQTIDFSKKQYLELSKLVILSWTLKMFLAILIPHAHPLYRTILGLDGIIFFAGDEYMTLPFFFAIIMCIKGRNLDVKKMMKVLLFIFILTLIAQRKGGIPIFISFFLLIWFHYREYRLGSFFLKLYYVAYTFIMFLFLYYIDYLFSDPLLLIAFSEYSTLANVAVDSISYIYNHNFLEFIFGISPFGKYEIINLPSVLDHFMSFGKEVGEKFRYQFWSFPLGRCLLNVGCLGFLASIYYHFKSMKWSLPKFFMIISAIPVCYYSNLTPVSAFAMGILFSFLYNEPRMNSNETYTLS
ncbi:hypothetical protein [Bacteroides sp.]|uniref:hypothetical protein n=1 Tax=Bacteroides sp. TaxID=29523 RepID=UPI002614BEE1|nr:hypothetical protein [Bacteroides sp.]MDD3037274.1 hypothetical protein [Bacteroides sp.]